MPRDPVCGMQVNEKSAIKIAKDGKNYFFCSTHCRDKFIKQEGLSAGPVCVPLTSPPFFKNKLFIISGICVLLIFVSFVIELLIPFRIIFISYLKTLWWAIALGVFLGGIIDYYIPREYISKILSKRRPSTILNAVLLGFLMSACSHGILALSMQLHKKGASGPAVISFLMASPWANFTITLMLIGFFGLKAIFIIIAAVVIAINTGLIFIFLEKKGWVEKNKNIIEVPVDFSVLKDLKVRVRNYKFGPKALINDLRGILRGAFALSDMVLWWVLLGMLIASISGAYIPVHFFHRFMGPTILGLFVTLCLAIVIEVCSEGSSPLAFEIYRQTGALGNSFVFLMAGVATDYTEIGLIWTNIGRRTALWLPVVSVPQIILCGYFANFFFR